jgi:hypothetical protein
MFVINQTLFLALQVTVLPPQKSERRFFFVTDDNKSLKSWINSVIVQIMLCVTRGSQCQGLLGNKAVTVILARVLFQKEKTLFYKNKATSA